MKLHSAKTSAASFPCFKPLTTETDKIFSYPSPLRRSDSEMDEYFPDTVRKKRGFIRSVKEVLCHIKLRGRNREMRIESESTKSSSSGCSFRLCRRSHDLKPKIDLTKSASMRSSTSLSSSRLSFQASESRTSVSSSINPNSNPIKNQRDQKTGREKQENLKEEQDRVKEQDSLKKQGDSVKKQSKLKNERSDSIIIGLLLIVISLAITVFWGRLWAIAFNAMWMAFIPESRILRSSRRRRSGTEDVDRMESIREQRRRRVIMEGLLDRTHHHHHQSQQSHK